MNGLELAKRFHSAYERLAPQFGYETRKDTKAFDPESPNGKLMAAVCQEVVCEDIVGKYELTQQESLVLTHLSDAWNCFAALSEGHPSDQEEFAKAIHAAESIIACRVAKRVDPDMWI